jgi:hypothetical protein
MLLSEVRDVAAPEHKLPNRSENNTTSGQVLGNAVTAEVDLGAGNFTGLATYQARTGLVGNSPTD